MTLSVILNLDHSSYDRLEAAAALHHVSPEELVRHAAMYAMADLDAGRVAPDTLRSSAAPSTADEHTLLVGFSDFGFDRISEAAERYGLPLQGVLRAAIAHYLEEAAAGRSAGVVPLVVPDAAEPAAAAPAPDAAESGKAGRRARASRRRLAAPRAGGLAAAALAAAASAVLILELPGRDGRPPKGIPLQVVPPARPGPPEAGALSALPASRGQTTATVEIRSDAGIARRARPPVVATPRVVGQPAAQTALLGLTPTSHPARPAPTAGTTQALRAAESGVVSTHSGRHDRSGAKRSSKATGNQRQSKSRHHRRARHLGSNHQQGSPKSAGIARAALRNNSHRRLRQARHRGRRAHQWLHAALKPLRKGDHHGRRGAASDKGHSRPHREEHSQQGDHQKHSAKAKDGGHSRKAAGRAKGHGHRHGGHRHGGHKGK
jgi:hypothetical protein